MTAEQRKAYIREQEIAKREQLRKAKLKKQRQKRKLFFIVELMCIFGMLTFLIGRKIGAQSVSAEELIVLKEPELTFHNMDTSSRQPDAEKSVLPETADLPKNILLVNKDNKLPENYEVELVTLEDGVNRSAKEAYEPLCNMLRAGRKEGLVFEICSAYRSVERQQELFDEDMDALLRAGYSYSRAYEEVAKETMPPGYSEHSTGLAFDIVAYDYQMLDEGQEETAENQWLQAHCAEYGFILRYPKDKEEITQISYESWHFRYVGVEAAKYITENQLTLEEYLEL